MHLAFHKFYICYYFNLLPINYSLSRISVIVSKTLQSKSTNCHACFEIVSPATKKYNLAETEARIDRLVKFWFDWWASSNSYD